MITNNTMPYKLKRPRRGVREATEVQEKRFGYFPKRFRWRGHIYHVEQVEQCWTTMKRSPALCFRVRCPEGRFELFQDVKSNSWEVARI